MARLDVCEGRICCHKGGWKPERNNNEREERMRSKMRGRKIQIQKTLFIPREMVSLQLLLIRIKAQMNKYIKVTECRRRLWFLL